jgi:hypothetical protein
MTSGRGGYRYERMLLDSIIMCIAYLTQHLAVSKEVLLSMGKGWMGKSRLLDCIIIYIAYWTVGTSDFDAQMSGIKI